MSELTIETADGAPDIHYVATIDGTATKTRVSDTVSSAGESNDTITTRNGLTTIRGKTGGGYGDAFTVSGQVTDVTTTGDAGQSTASVQGGQSDDSGGSSGMQFPPDLGWTDYAIAAAIVGYYVFG